MLVAKEHSSKGASILPLLEEFSQLAVRLGNTSRIPAAIWVLNRGKMKYTKKILKILTEKLEKYSNKAYLSNHPQFEYFDMPEYFYFRYLPDRTCMHWATIKEQEENTYIYFVDKLGRIFDKLEVKSIKIARRELRKNGFEFSTNRYCPFKPIEPIYIRIFSGKRSALYSIGNLWKKVKRNKKNIDKLEKTYIKAQIKYIKNDKKCTETLSQNCLQRKKEVNINIWDEIYKIIIFILICLILRFFD